MSFHSFVYRPASCILLLMWGKNYCHNDCDNYQITCILWNSSFFTNRKCGITRFTTGISKTTNNITFGNSLPGGRSNPSTFAMTSISVSEIYMVLLSDCIHIFTSLITSLISENRKHLNVTPPENGLKINDHPDYIQLKPIWRSIRIFWTVYWFKRVNVYRMQGALTNVVGIAFSRDIVF